jgi:hypothetical protein
MQAFVEHERQEKERIMVPKTTARVADHTAPEINEAIRRQTQENVAYFAAAGPDAIGRRLEELDREWDVERILETNAATVVLVTTLLGATVNRRWFLFPAIAGGFLLQHAIQGWCPPVPVIRRLGFRTANEIAEERYALKTLRGDFREVPAAADKKLLGTASAVLQAVRR